MSRLSRLLSFAILLVFAASSFESVAGVIRDGDVHPESPGTSVHFQDIGSDHQHDEDVPEGTDHDSHKHGTSGDHCTHLHALGIPSTHALEFANRQLELAETRALVRFGTFPTPLFHPPRA
mgnify:FL=1